MEFDMELAKQQIDELINLWIETKIRCDKIENLIKQVKESEK